MLYEDLLKSRCEQLVRRIDQEYYNFIDNDTFLDKFYDESVDDFVGMSGQDINTAVNRLHNYLTEIIMQQVPRIIQPAEKSLYEALRP
jgi:hypothetical protein